MHHKVKEWLHSLGVFDQVAVVQDDEEPDDGAVPLHHKESSKHRLLFVINSINVLALVSICLMNSKCMIHYAAMFHQVLFSQFCVRH